SFSDGNITKTAYFNITVLPGMIKSPVYTVNGKFITGVTEMTLAGEFLKMLEGGEIRIFSEDGEITGEEIFLCTGMEAALYIGDEEVQRLIIVVRGDITGSGEISAAGARLVLRVVAKLEAVPEAFYMAGDMDGDGALEANDARLILRRVAKLY
ncbi:MAG: hypothetical protein FWF08_09820, partial [Oscillospiraceae bacterium]|nr:hypothetical protein [Oscillospiraceae bacterium]